MKLINLILVIIVMCSCLRNDEYFFEKGQEFKRQGKYEEAILAYNKAISINPDNCVIFNNRGVVYERLGKNKEALKDFNTCIRIDPSDPVKYLNRGKIYAKLSEYQSAVRDLQTAVMKDTGLVESHYYLGVSLYRLGLLDEALVELLKSTEIKNLGNSAMQFIGHVYCDKMQYDSALFFYHKTNDKSLDGNILFNIGFCHFNLNHNDSCEIYMTRSIEVTPNSFNYSLRALNRKYMNKLEGAVLDYSNAIKYDSTSSENYYNRALTYVELKEYELACEDLYSAMKLGDEDAKKLYNMKCMH